MLEEKKDVSVGMWRVDETIDGMKLKRGEREIARS